MNFSNQLNNYRKAYFYFHQVLNRTQMVSVIAAHSMERFPERLPEELKLAVLDLFKATTSAMSSVVAKESPIEVSFDLDFSSDSEIRWFGQNVLEMTIASYLGFDGKPSSHQKRGAKNSAARKILFGGDGEVIQRFPRQQALAMIFAHFDAFFGATIRCICQAKPQVLNTNKQITWSQVLEFDNMENLVDYITEQYVYEFGWKPIKDRLQALRDRVGLVIEISDSDLEFISLFEQRRHLIIHNGGIVTPRYIRDSGDNATKIGAALDISGEDMRRLHDVVRLLGGALFTEVSKKLLGAEPKDLTGVWARQRAEKKGSE
ncbi:hypothetical protein ACOTJG_26185 [Achromobacter xylosoxidans]